MKIAAAARPGTASGRATRRNAVHRVQPRVCAASSSSWETLTKTPLVTRIAKGSAIAACTSATPKTLSYKPMRRNVTASGIERIAMGNILVARTTIARLTRPRKRKRARL